MGVRVLLGAAGPVCQTCRPPFVVGSFQNERDCERLLTVKARSMLQFAVTKQTLHSTAGRTGLSVTSNQKPSFPMPSLLSQLTFWLLFTVVVEHTFASSAAGTETLVGIVGKDFVLLAADSSVSQSIALTASNLDKIAILADPFPSGRPDRALTNRYAQHVIAAAAAGDAADADRLLGVLRAHAAIREFEVGVGCDVEYIDCEKSTDDAQSSIAQTPSSPAGMTVESLANLARGQIATQLRSASPFRVCLLVGGMMPVEDSMIATHSLSCSQSAAGSPSDLLQRQVRFASAPFLVTPEEPPIASTVSSPSAVASGLVPRLYWLDEYGSLQTVPYGAHGHGANFILSILDQGYRPDLDRQQAADLLRRCFAQLRTRYVINSPEPPCIKCIDASGCRLLR